MQHALLYVYVLLTLDGVGRMSSENPILSVDWRNYVLLAKIAHFEYVWYGGLTELLGGKP